MLGGVWLGLRAAPWQWVRAVVRGGGRSCVHTHVWDEVVGSLALVGGWWVDSACVGGRLVAVGALVVGCSVG